MYFLQWQKEQWLNQEIKIWFHLKNVTFKTPCTRKNFHPSGDRKKQLLQQSTHHSKPYTAFVDSYAQSVFLKVGEINHRYHIKCVCLNCHSVRVNSQNPQQLVYDRPFTTPLASSLVEIHRKEKIRCFCNTQ